MKLLGICGVAAAFAATAAAGCSGGGSGAPPLTQSTTAVRAVHKSLRPFDLGAITEYPIPTNNSLPIGITVGPDGALWFAEHQAGKIGRITTSGTITEPDKLTGPAHFPLFLVTGSDGNLWATGDSAPSYKSDPRTATIPWDR